MQNVIDHLKRNWKVYAVAVWMFGTSGFLFYLDHRIAALHETASKLTSDVDAIESIMVSTDNNVAEMKKTVDAISPRIVTIHKRVMRR